MLKRLWTCVSFLGLFFLSSTGFAVNDNANCGPGKSMASSENAIVTVNISSSLTYAAATTSSTSGCEGPFASGGRTSGRFTQLYLAHNFERISEEIAQGRGPYLQTLAGMMGCKKDAQAIFTQLTQEAYPELFKSVPASHLERFRQSRELIKKMKNHIVNNPQLSQMCATS
ncbi:MAG: DUF3015 family protein [SAR324 cluster bacterium]|nr:DUF3015 family protein [SAR324 cluster bacterium]